MIAHARLAAYRKCGKRIIATMSHRIRTLALRALVPDFAAATFLAGAFLAGADLDFAAPVAACGK